MSRTVNLFTVPPEYVIARDAVQTLVSDLAEVVRQFQGGASSPALWHTDVVGQIQAALQRLEHSEKHA